MKKLTTIIYTTCYQSKAATNTEKTMGTILFLSLIVIAVGSLLISSGL